MGREKFLPPQQQIVYLSTKILWRIQLGGKMSKNVLQGENEENWMFEKHRFREHAKEIEKEKEYLKFKKPN